MHSNKCHFSGLYCILCSLLPCLLDVDSWCQRVFFNNLSMLMGIPSKIYNILYFEPLYHVFRLDGTFHLSTYTRSISISICLHPYFAIFSIHVLCCCLKTNNKLFLGHHTKEDKILLTVLIQNLLKPMGVFPLTSITQLGHTHSDWKSLTWIFPLAAESLCSDFWWSVNNTTQLDFLHLKKLRRS